MEASTNETWMLPVTVSNALVIYLAAKLRFYPVTQVLDVRWFHGVMSFYTYKYTQHTSAMYVVHINCTGT